jgi:tetratricopeptide (TPR) repeat protein
MTIRRNLDWYSDYTLWKAAAKTVSTNARAYYEIGTAALKEDKYDEVIDAMKESIRLSGAITASDTKRYALLPESYLHWVWLNLGLAYQKKGETDNAIEAYKKVIEIKPDYVASYNNLGNAYLSKNMTEEALNMYKKSIEVDPNTAEGYYNLGILYSRKGDNNKALQLYSKAITIRPEYADVWFASGIVEYNRRDYARAAQLFKKAVEINPGFTAAKSNYEISLEMAQDKSSQ